MYWHIDTDIISLIITAAIYIYCRKLSSQDDNPIKDRRFLRCLTIGIFVTVVDIAASVIMEVPTSRFMYHLLMTLYFVCIELVIVEWFIYVLTILYPNNDPAGKAMGYAAMLLYAMYAVFNCINPWSGAVYWLGPNNEYNRGPFFGAMLALYIVYSVAMLVLILVRWKHIPKDYPAGVLLATPLIIAAGIVLQLSVPGLLLILPSYTVCLVLAFLFLQNMQSKNSRQLLQSLSRVAETDVLTGLYNRSGMEAMVQKTIREDFWQAVLVLIVDIDDLKTINDTLGHDGGDEAIQLVARQLKNHFRARDTVVRYGGDEFLAFLTGAFTEAQIRSSVESLVNELAALHVGGKNGTYLHGSIGAAYGVVGRESFELLCKQADIALYHVKRHGKNAYAFYRPEMEAELLLDPKHIQGA